MNSFRNANKHDVTKIVKLVESSYRGDASRQGWTTEADLLAGQRTDQREVEALIRLKNSKIILYENKKDLMASVHVCNKGSYAYLGMFAVKPGCQGQGIGKLLLGYVENFVLKDWQCHYIEMAVISQRTELISWYEKQGYKLTEEIRPFPYGDERYGIPRRDDLTMNVLIKYLS